MSYNIQREIYLLFLLQMINAATKDPVKSVNTSSDNKNKLSIDQLKGMENTSENRSILSEYSDDDLKNMQTEVIDSEDYEVAAIIRDVLNDKKAEWVETNSEVQKKLVKDQAKQDQENTKKQQEILDQRKKNKQEQSDQEKDLKAKLFEQNKEIDSLKEEINKLNKRLDLHVQENSNNLNEVLEAKKSWDSEKLEELLAENKRLREEKAAMKQEVLKYPPDKIQTLNTKRIKWRFISKKTIKTEEWSETTIKRPSVKRNKNIRSRRKLNQVVKAFNWFKKDSDNAVKYILTQERWNRVDHLSWADAIWQSINRFEYKFLHKLWFVMSKAKFEEKFSKQQAKIIGQFKTNINPAEWTKEFDTIKTLEAWMKYYKEDYMRKHYW